ncbi:hypothetical protein [Methylocystis rosea]|uniref:hypothetical protein n=1 Tax=Methylocystis rosea TaxID=173366 RepID=UPI00036F342A|nr:hypothetical protein [Methylocystis rosea]
MVAAVAAFGVAHQLGVGLGGALAQFRDVLRPAFRALLAVMENRGKDVLKSFGLE